MESVREGRRGRVRFRRRGGKEKGVSIKMVVEIAHWGESTI